MQQRAGGRAGTQPCPPRSPALLGLMLMGWKPAVRMEESATSASRPPFLRQYTSTPTSSSSTRHTATAISPTYSATSSAPWAAARGRASAPRGAAPCPRSPVPRRAPHPVALTGAAELGGAVAGLQLGAVALLAPVARRGLRALAAPPVRALGPAHRPLAPLRPGAVHCGHSGGQRLAGTPSPEPLPLPWGRDGQTDTHTGGGRTRRAGWA